MTLNQILDPIGELNTTFFTLWYSYLFLLIIYLNRKLLETYLRDLISKKYKEQNLYLLKPPFVYPNLDTLEENKKRGALVEVVSAIVIAIMVLKIYLSVQNKYSNDTNDFKTFRRIFFASTIEIDPLFDPFYPNGDFTDWLKKKKPSLDQSNWLDIIEQSRVFFVYQFFSIQKENRERIAFRLKKSLKDLNDLIDNINMRELLKYERNYLIFRLERLLKE